MTLRWLTALLALLALAFVPLSCERTAIHIGSKAFTESVVLGELATHLARGTGEHAVHRQSLGGTRLVFDALVNGDIDLYPEYTGTISHEIFAARRLRDTEALRRELAEYGVRMTEPLGFSNSYEIAMRRDVSEELGIAKISDLRRHPNLKLRFSNEYMNRDDGWPSLKRHYGLPHQDVAGVDHDIAYRQLDRKVIHVTDTYTTDAKKRYYDLRVLEDDRSFFPSYDAVFLYRADLIDRAPRVVEALGRLERNVSEHEIMEMNRAADILRVSETRAAARFLSDKFALEIEVEEETVGGRIWKHTLEHVELVRKSLIAAILAAIPLGVLAAKMRGVGPGIIAAVGMIQTIPALALLVMLMAPVDWLGLSTIGAGSATAVIALFLYSLLPIVRNTYSGLHDIRPALSESAAALGLPPAARLWRIELPLASRTILAGIKTAAVINVGFATLGALIGAGGYGQPILTGIRLNDTALVLQGAIPAAAMALAVQGLFDLLERALVSKGLRLKTEH